MTNYGKLASLSLGLAIFFNASRSDASITFSTAANAQVSGQAVSAQGVFGEIGSTGAWDGSIVISSLIATPTKAQLLTGVLFSINGSNPVLSLTSAGMSAGSVLVLNSSGSTSSAAIDLIADNGAKSGRYQFKGTPGGTIGSGNFAQEYGVATIGGGVFNGNIVGNDDYAIMGPGTNVALNTFSNQFPYVRSGVAFQFSGQGTGVNLANVTGVTFLYGSLPDGFVPGSAPPSVPEPATIATAIVGSVFGLGMLRKRRKQTV